MKLSGASTAKGVFTSSIKRPMLMLDHQSPVLLPMGMMNTTRHDRENSKLMMSKNQSITQKGREIAADVESRHPVTSPIMSR